MKILNVLTSAVILAGTISSLHAQVAQENPSDFAGGVLNPEGVNYDPVTNTATIDFQVNQTYLGTNGKSLIPGGAVATDVKVLGEVRTAITGEQYTPIEFPARRTISSQVLTCSEPEDRCRGCFTTAFQGSRRIDSLVNGAVIYTVRNRQLVKPSNGQPLVLAPGFYGPTWLEVEPGKVNELQLKQFVTSARPVKCSLRAEEPTASGIERNPCAGPFCLNVSDDCTVSWNTENTQVGQKYAFQMLVIEEGNHYCQGYTDVDFIVEVGCPSGDFTCLQCSDVDVSAVLASVQKAFSDQTGLLDSVLGQIAKKVKKLRKIDNASNTFRLRNNSKKQRERFMTRAAELSQAITNTLSAQPQLIQNCLRPSSLFCQKSDMTSAVTPVIAAAQENHNTTLTLIKRYLRLIRAVKRHTGKGNAKKAKILLLAQNSTFLSNTITALGPLNGVVSQCNVPR